MYVRVRPYPFTAISYVLVCKKCIWIEYFSCLLMRFLFKQQKCFYFIYNSRHKFCVPKLWIYSEYFPKLPASFEQNGFNFPSRLKTNKVQLRKLILSIQSDKARRARIKSRLGRWINFLSASIWSTIGKLFQNMIKILSKLQQQRENKNSLISFFCIFSVLKQIMPISCSI